MIFIDPKDFSMSKKLYAVRHEFASIKDVSQMGRPPLYRIEIESVWFQRKQGATGACIGTLWDYQHQIPSSVEDFLAKHTDGRHGGSCRTRWYASNSWSYASWDQVNEDLSILKPMLANYPQVPEGFTGWYRF